MVLLYSILLIVDFSPTTFYCLPKPLFMYGSMVLLSTLLVLSSNNVLLQTVVMLGYDWWLCMVINIRSVQYSGGFLPDIV